MAVATLATVQFCPSCPQSLLYSKGISAAAGDTSGIILRQDLQILQLFCYKDNVVDKLYILDFYVLLTNFLSDTKGDSGELGLPGAVGQKVRNGPHHYFIQ